MKKITLKQINKNFYYKNILEIFKSELDNIINVNQNNFNLDFFDISKICNDKGNENIFVISLNFENTENNEYLKNSKFNRNLENNIFNSDLSNNDYIITFENSFYLNSQYLFFFTILK